MTQATIVTRRYIKCPACGYEQGFCIEHMFEVPNDYRFGPWSCDQRDCDAVIRGVLHVADGTVDIEMSKRDSSRGFALVRLGDGDRALYLVLREKYGRVTNWDYFYHSHQCPTNLLHNVDAVFSVGGIEPESEWPEANGGLIPMIAELRREAIAKREFSVVPEGDE